MAKTRSSAAVLRAAQNRPLGNRPSTQRSVREGCIATLRRALRNRITQRWARVLEPIARGPSLIEATPTTVVEL